MWNKKELDFYIPDYHNLRIVECFDCRISNEKYNYIITKHERDLEIAKLIKKTFSKGKDAKKIKEWLNNDK